MNGMSRNEARLLRQEAGELTHLLRVDRAWESLRRALLKKGLDVGEVVMGGYHEDEHDNEYGVVVALDGRAFRFERCTLEGTRDFTVWDEVDLAGPVSEEFPAVRFAHDVAMATGASKEAGPPGGTMKRKGAKKTGTVRRIRRKK